MSKRGKKGEDWRNQVLFDPEPAESAYRYLVDDESLIADMRELIDDNELILQIWVCKKPLSNFQLTQLLFNHQFVVLETASWWWSVEKDGEQILIQRSKNLSAVRDYVQREPRITPVVEMSYDIGRKSIDDLIEFLYRKNELNKRYHWIGDNCHAFARRVFNAFAKTKIHDIVFGC